MKREDKLEAISNGFYAANKIRQTLDPIADNNSRISVHRDNLESINEIFNIIKQYFPNSYRHNFLPAIDKSMEYSRAYKNIKQHFSSEKDKKMDNEMFIKTVKVMKPILNNKQNVIIDKFLKIAEILYS